MKLSTLPLRVLLGLLSCASFSAAGVTTYSTYASWAAAVGVPIHPITFQPVLPSGPYASGITIDTVFFQGISAGPGNGYLYQNYGGYCAPTGCLLGPGTEAGALGATDGYLRSTLAGPGNAIAVDYGAYHSAGDIPVFRFSNGDSYVGPNIAPGTTFIGFITDTPFLYLDYHVSAGTSGGDTTVYDTVYIPTGVPEPSTYALCLAGVAALAARQRRRQRWCAGART